MRQPLRNGWALIKSSAQILRVYPALSLPLICAWIVAATVTLTLRYADLAFGIDFALFALLPLSITAACLALLEMVRQIESGEQPSWSKTLVRVWSKDMIRALPIAAIWAVLWFVLLVLKALTSRRDESRHEASVQDAAQTLSGMNGSFNMWSFGLDMISKLLRMTVFMVMPAIAWQGEGPRQAWRSAKNVIRKHPKEFLSDYGLTAAAGAALALPLVPIAILGKSHVELPDAVWLAVIIYSGIIWSIEVYLEQMSVAMLYLWHLKWERAGSQGPLDTVPMPDLLDGVSEFQHIADTSSAQPQDNVTPPPP